MNNVAELLHSVDKIKTRYNEIARTTGENYNLFEILNIETKEFVHTYFLADMLNPKGVHGLGNFPLRLFLQKIGKYELFSDDLRVYAEKDYGAIDKLNTLGGRIDISLENKSGKSILIENKIYARDQENQLLRYYNTFKDGDGSFLLYLTLDGRDPSKQSISSSSKNELVSESDYLCISYKDHIKKWLEKCHEKAIDLPLLRETLKQYIALINKLTGNSTNRKMSKEIGKQLAQSEENIENAYEIALSIDSMKEELLERLFVQVKSHFDNKGFTVDIQSDGIRCWYITLSGQIHGFDIYICFDEGIIFLGVRNPEPTFDDSKKVLFTKLNAYKECHVGKETVQPNESWYANDIWFTPDTKIDYYPEEKSTWLSIQNEKLSKQIIDEFKKFIEFINDSL